MVAVGIILSPFLITAVVHVTRRYYPSDFASPSSVVLPIFPDTEDPFCFVCSDFTGPSVAASTSSCSRHRVSPELNAKRPTQEEDRHVPAPGLPSVSLLIESGPWQAS